MKLRHLVPFAILLAWQVAPFPGDSTPSRRRFSLALGYGLAQLDDYTPASCWGPEQSARVEVQSVGARADMVTSGGLRVTAFGGNTKTSAPWTAGPFGGVQVAYEGARLGIGAGVTTGVMTGSASTTSTAPNLYLRLGRISSTNFRMEFVPPSEALGVVSSLRAGMGFNEGRQDRVGSFAGVGLVPGGGQPNLVAFADLAIPTGAALDVLVRSQLGRGRRYTIWSLALGAQYRFGS